MIYSTMYNVEKGEKHEEIFEYFVYTYLLMHNDRV